MEDGGELGLKALTDNINRCIKIVITDTGVGIPPENLDKILEPFFTTKKNGTGLGLGLAYQAILAHNGSVKINSSNGKGTMVDINLPFNNGKNTNNR
jgi:signal transduction histidine kinase